MWSLIVQKICLLSYLLICSISDIGDMCISVRISLVFGAAGIVFCFGSGMQVSSIIESLIPGLTILGIAKLTDEAGEGDAVMLFVIGIFLGRINTFVILFIAVSLAFSIGGLIILCNGTKKKEIPFAPFLFGGYITAILTGAV